MQFFHEVDKKAFPVQNGSKWNWGHFKHVVKILSLVYIYFCWHKCDVAAYCLWLFEGSFECKKNHSCIFFVMYKTCIYIYIYLSAILCWELVVQDLLLELVKLGCNKKLWCWEIVCVVGNLYMIAGTCMLRTW